MTWVKLDDGFPEHPKLIQAGAAAGWLYVAALCYSARNLTDGHIPAAVLPRLADVKAPGRLAAKLVEARLFTDAATARRDLRALGLPLPRISG